MIWIITDTHFGHKNMIEYCGRPLGFENTIIKGLCNACKETDILIHLGDFCIGQDKKWHKVIKELSCKKWLVRGNHDRKSNSWYLSNGWDWIGDSMSMVYQNQNILFSHIPQKIGDFDINIHGHFHNTLSRLLEGNFISPFERNRNIGILEILTNKHILVALELSGYQPISLIKLLKKKK